MVGGDFSSDLGRFQENYMGLNGGRAGVRIWRRHLLSVPDIFLVLAEIALGRGQVLEEVLADQVGG